MKYVFQHFVMQGYPLYDIIELKMDIKYYVPIAGW